MLTPHEHRFDSANEPTHSPTPSSDNLQQIYFIVIIVGAVSLLLILIIVPVICHSHRKLANEVHNVDGMVMRNGLLVSIPIGIYDNPDDAEVPQHFSNLPVERDAKNIKALAVFLQYKFLTIHRKFKWTESEVMDFMTNKVGEDFFDSDGNPKYDGLIVSFSGHGVRNRIVTSDGKLIDRTSLHRCISNKYPKIREFPRIFLFDACDGAAKRREIVNGMERVDSESEADGYLTENEEKEKGNMIQIEGTVTETVKNTTLADVQNVDDWAIDTKNPDYNLIAVHASNAGFVAKMHGDEDVGSYLSWFFANKLRQNVKDGNTKGLGEMMDDIEEKLHDSGKQLIRTEFFTGTRSLRIEKRVRK